MRRFHCHFREKKEFFGNLDPCQVEMATCHGQGGEQDWAHTKEGKIIHKVKMFISKSRTHEVTK